LAEENLKVLSPLEDLAHEDFREYSETLDQLQQAVENFQQDFATYSVGCPPPPTKTNPTPVVIIPISNTDPGDPNGITGPAGYSSPGPQWVAGQTALPYVVNFRNEPTATAAATQVVVTEAVPTGIDPSSVQLTGFGFGASTSVSIPPGQQSFSSSSPTSVSER